MKLRVDCLSNFTQNLDFKFRKKSLRQAVDIVLFSML